MAFKFISQISPVLGAKIIKTDIKADQRGFFHAVFSEKEFDKIIPEIYFVQDAIQFLKQNTLLGLHIQDKQGKLILCSQGSMEVVWVDLRKKSQSLGKWDKTTLHGCNGESVWIPQGCAFGLYAIQDCVAYLKVTEPFSEKSGIVYNDEELNIKWQGKSPSVSERDLKLPSFSEYLKLVR